MLYVQRRPRDSTSRIAPLLLAAGSAALLALLWRRRAAPRIERHVDVTHAPLAETAGTRFTGHDAQTVDGGTGALFHRLYEVVLTDVGITTTDALWLMHRHLTDLSPSPLAHFEKTTGGEGLLRVGDEFSITMLGPWNGMVRVVESTLDHFTLATLDGHPEAGHITFRTSGSAEAPQQIRISIESWARARDTLVAAAYGTFGIGKQIQTEVWITFLQRLSALAGAEHTPQVQITTEQLAESPPIAQPSLTTSDTASSDA
jgi:hypothetical protein